MKSYFLGLSVLFIVPEVNAQSRTETTPGPPPIVVVERRSETKDAPNQPPMPIGDPGQWVSNDDFPEDAEREGLAGTVAFKLVISPTGTVSDCVIVQGSGSEILDRHACDIAKKRGKFRPATDAMGKPTYGTWASRIHFAYMEADTFETNPSIGRTVIEFTVGKYGKARDCRILAGPDVVKMGLFVMPCDAEEYYPGFTDKNGDPIEKLVRVVVNVTLPDEQPPKRKKK